MYFFEHRYEVYLHEISFCGNLLYWSLFLVNKNELFTPLTRNDIMYKYLSRTDTMDFRAVTLQNDTGSFIWYVCKVFRKTKFLTYPLIRKHRFFWHRCFPVNFAKFLSTPFLQNTSGRLLLYLPGHRQSKYPKLENYLKKSFLGTKHLQNLLLAKYLISVSATLILSVTLLRKIVLE